VCSSDLNPLVVLHSVAAFNFNGPDDAERLREPPIPVGQRRLVQERIVLGRPRHTLRTSWVEQMNVRIDDRYGRGSCTPI
jgi:hypothetical protein